MSKLKIQKENAELRGQIMLSITQRDAALRDAGELRQQVAAATAIAVRAEEKADRLERENDILRMRMPMPRFRLTDDESKELGEIEQNVRASRSLREEAERLLDEAYKVAGDVSADWAHALRASVERRVDRPVDVITLRLPERWFSVMLAPDWRKMGPDQAVHYIWEKLGPPLRMTAAKAIDSAFRGGEK